MKNSFSMVTKFLIIRPLFMETRLKGKIEEFDGNSITKPITNKPPRGIIWSAIPLPCLSNRYKVILFGYSFGGRAAASIGFEAL